MRCCIPLRARGWPADRNQPQPEATYLPALLATHSTLQGGGRKGAKGVESYKLYIFKVLKQARVLASSRRQCLKPDGSLEEGQQHTLPPTCWLLPTRH